MGEDRQAGAAATEYGLLLAAVAIMITFVASALGLVSAGTLGSLHGSMAAHESTAGSSGMEAMQAAPAATPATTATTVRAGRRCDQHGASALTASGVRVQCTAGPRGVYRWRRP